VTTGDALVAYDLSTRSEEVRWQIPGASAVAVDESQHQVIIGTVDGRLLGMSLNDLDEARASGTTDAFEPLPLANLDGPVMRLEAFENGARVAAVLDRDRVVVLDDVNGSIVGRGTVPGIRDLTPAGRGPALVASPDELEDRAATLGSLADILGVEVADLDAKVEAAASSDVVLAGAIDEDLRTELETAIESDALVGVRVEDVDWLAVSGTDGVTFLTPGADAAHLVPPDDAGGLALVTGIEEGSQLWVTSRDDDSRPVLTRIDVTGKNVTAPRLQGARIRMPGDVERVLFDRATELIHVLGVTPDGAMLLYRGNGVGAWITGVGELIGTEW